MAQIVKAEVLDLRRLQRRVPLGIEPDRPATLAWEDQLGIEPANLAMLAQQFRDFGHDGHASPLAVRLVKHGNAPLKVHVLPAKPEKLTAPHPGRHGKEHDQAQRLVFRFGAGIEQRGALVVREIAHPARRLFHLAHAPQRVIGQQVPLFNRVAERLAERRQVAVDGRVAHAFIALELVAVAAEQLGRDRGEGVVA